MLPIYLKAFIDFNGMFESNYNLSEWYEGILIISQTWGKYSIWV